MWSSIRAAILPSSICPWCWATRTWALSPAVGEGVTEYQVGDRILCGPPSHCAEDCPSCQRGETNICIYGFPRTAGIGGPDGGYAEYMLVRDVKHTMLVKVPDGVDLKDAVLFDVICVALHGIRKSNFKVGDNVVVSGTGPIGLSALQFLKAAGANKIIALGTSPSKYPTLKKYGADYCLNPKELGDKLGDRNPQDLRQPRGGRRSV